MAIKPSSAKQIESLAADLGSSSAATREAAVARLTVLGARAVQRLIALATSTAGAPTRAAAWRTLEAIGDRRALDPALAALADAAIDPVVGSAAVGVARIFLLGDRGVIAIDRLASVVLDRDRLAPLRVAALRALLPLGRSTIEPILSSLAGDPSPLMQEALLSSAALERDGSRQRADDPVTTLTRAADESLPDDPAALRRALSRADDVPVSRLLRIVERVRDREASEPAASREEWTMARGAAHVALANRGSRIALYDLRESLERTASPLPVEFLAALSRVGDASCLEAIAGAHAKARNGWWRQHLADVFRTIVSREHLTRRHAVVRKIEKRWPGGVSKMADG